MTDPVADTEIPTNIDLPTILALGEQMMPDYTTMSAVEAREVLAAMPPRPSPDVADAVDVSLSDDVSGRVYTPLEGDDGPFVVYYHGGGFTVGNVEVYDGSCRRLCAALGLPLLSVEYRLGPEHPFPAAVDDAWTALTWAASNHGADGLIVAGDSAGANLAAVTALRAAQEGIELRHQLLTYPCFDPSCSHDSHGRPENDTPFLSADDMVWYWRQYLGGSEAILDANGGTTDERIDPRHAAVPSGLTPATVVLAGRDPLHDEGAEYADRLAAAGVPVTTLEYPNLFHAFVAFAGLNDECTTACDEAAAAVRAALATSVQPPA